MNALAAFNFRAVIKNCQNVGKIISKCLLDFFEQ